jgi:hypothetical protein
MAKKVLLDLAMKLSADSAELKKGVEESNRQLRTLNKSAQDMSKNITKAFGAVAVAFGVVKGAISTFNGAIRSTQATSDLFDKTIGGLSEGMGVLNRAIATMDFSNFIDNIKRAAQAGRDYVEALDEIADRNRALNTRDSKLRLDLARLDGVIFDPGTDPQEKLNAAKQKELLIEEHLQQKMKTRQMLYDAEIERIRKIHNLTEEQAKSIGTLFENYDIIKDSNATQNIDTYRASSSRLSSAESSLSGMNKIPVRDMAPDQRLDFAKRKEALQEEIKQLQKYKAETEATLTAVERAWMIAFDSITDSVRDDITKSISEIYTAEAELLTQRNQALRQQGRLEKKVSDPTETISKEKELVGELNVLYAQLSSAKSASTAATGNEIAFWYREIERIQAQINNVEKRAKDLSTYNTMPSLGMPSSGNFPESIASRNSAATISLVPEYSGLDAFNDALDETFTRMNTIYTMQDAIEAGFKSMFDQGESGMKGFISSLLQVIQGLFALAIANSIASESKKGLIGLITGAVAVAGISALWNAKVPDFADGGLVYGETILRAGEYPGARTNPEVIAPLSDLKHMLGNNNNIKGEVKFIIKGDQLEGILSKRNQRRGAIQ